MIPVRKPVQSSLAAKPPDSSAQEVSFAVTHAIQALRETFREEIRPLRLEVEKLKADLSLVEQNVEVAQKPKLSLTIQDASDLWNVRACFVCSKYGACEHREIEVAMAELYAMRDL